MRVREGGSRPREADAREMPIASPTEWGAIVSDLLDLLDLSHLLDLPQRSYGSDRSNRCNRSNKLAQPSLEEAEQGRWDSSRDGADRI